MEKNGVSVEPLTSIARYQGSGAANINVINSSDQAVRIITLKEGKHIDSLTED